MVCKGRISVPSQSSADMCGANGVSNLHSTKSELWLSITTDESSNSFSTLNRV